MVLKLKGQASYSIAIRHFNHRLNSDLDNVDSEVKKMNSKLVGRMNDRFMAKMESAMTNLNTLQADCDEMEVLDIKSKVLEFEQEFRSACIDFKREIEEHQTTLKKFAHRYDNLREVVVSLGARSLTDFLRDSINHKDEIVVRELSENPTFSKVALILRVHEMLAPNVKAHVEGFLAKQSSTYAEAYNEEAFSLLDNGESTEKLGKKYYDKVDDMLRLSLFELARTSTQSLIEPNEDGKDFLNNKLEVASNKYADKHRDEYEQRYVELLDEKIKG